MIRSRPFGNAAGSAARIAPSRRSEQLALVLLEIELSQEHIKNETLKKARGDRRQESRLEPLHQEFCPAPSLLSCLAERQIVHAPAGVRRTICCHSSRRTIAVGPIGHDSDAEVILLPQPASPVSDYRICWQASDLAKLTAPTKNDGAQAEGLSFVM